MRAIIPFLILSSLAIARQSGQASASAVDIETKRADEQLQKADTLISISAKYESFVLSIKENGKFIHQKVGNGHSLDRNISDIELATTDIKSDYNFVVIRLWDNPGPDFIKLVNSVETSLIHAGYKHISFQLNRAYSIPIYREWPRATK